MKISSLATLAAAVVAVGVSVAACGTTNNNAVEQSSALGESCAQTADCKVGVCVNQTCVMGPQSADGGGSSSGASSSGASSSGSGGSSSGGSSGGSSSGGVAEAAAPHVSLRGEACQSTAQCAAGLACVQTGSFGSTGVCDIASFGLSANATGKTCTGECSVASDCCELPVNVTVNGIVYHHCNDILNQVIGGAVANCAGLAAGDSTAVGVGCFYYQTYCGTCTTANWTCTNNQCIYGATCMASGTVIQGCAPMTRTGRSLVGTCTTTGTPGTCSPPPGACSANADCAGKAYTPAPGIGATSNICRAPGATGTTDCVCQAGGCYLLCTKDLDCAKGYTCDTAKSLCKSVGSCTADYQCAQSMRDVRSTCSNGACTAPCSTDLDCSLAGGTGGHFTGSVCVGATATAAGTCQTLGCSTDTDCNTPSGGATPHVFCVTPPAVSAALEVSAITN
jgi:hypothetical protein